MITAGRLCWNVTANRGRHWRDVHGKGGTEPIITDAALILGYLDPKTFVEATDEGVGWGATDAHDGEHALIHISES